MMSEELSAHLGDSLSEQVIDSGYLVSGTGGIGEIEGSHVAPTVDVVKGECVQLQETPMITRTQKPEASHGGYGR